MESSNSPYLASASIEMPQWLAVINRVHQVVACSLLIVVVVLLICDPSVVPLVLPLARMALLVCLMLCSTANDLSTHRIPNQITYASLSAACVLLLLTSVFQLDGLDPALSVVDAGMAVIVSAVFMLAGWMAKSVGGGDVKLVIAAAALLGLCNVVTCTLVAHAMALVLMVVLAIASMMLQMGSRFFNGPSQPAPVRSFTLKSKIPMAGFYALATVVTLWLELPGF